MKRKAPAVKIATSGRAGSPSPAAVAVLRGARWVTMAAEVNLEEQRPWSAAEITGVVVVAGVSLLAHPGGDLWNTLASHFSFAGAGWAEEWIVRQTCAAMGPMGPGLLRAATAAFVASRVLRGSGGFFGRLVLALSLALLLPWGPGLFFLPMLILVASAASRRPLVALGLCFLWPMVDGGFILGGVLVALEIARLRKGRPWLFALAPLVNPAAVVSIFSGRAFTLFFAARAGYPGYAGPLPDHPGFYLVAVWAVAATFSAWSSIGELSTVAVSTFAGLVLRPFSSLPVFIASRPRGSSGGLLFPALVSLPFILWMILAPRPVAVPSGATAILADIPPGGWTLRADPAWSAGAALKLGADHIVPRFETRGLLDARRRYPKGLLPPFKDAPDPRCDVLLLKPNYPTDPYRLEMRKGWHLLAAAPGFAVFARSGNGLEAWVRKHSLKAYNPWFPPPDDPEERRLALDEARGLLTGEPRFFQALRDAGRMETDFGLYNDAVRHLKEALALAPKNAKLWNDVGVALQFEGAATESELAYVKSIELNPSELLPRLNLANLFLQTGKYGKAENLLKGMILSRPRAYIAYRRLAQTLKVQGRNAEAVEVLKRIPPDMRTAEDLDLLKSCEANDKKRREAHQ